MQVIHFFDPDTYTLTYLVFDALTKDAVVIDPVMDYDPLTGLVTNKTLKHVFEFIDSNHLTLLAVLETHAHADHISGSQLLKAKYECTKIGIGAGIQKVQNLFKKYFNLTHVKTDGSQFDLIFADFEEIDFGSLKMRAIPTPGHTPACMSFQFGEFVFTGDALFMPDYGTGRCDFPEGSAKQLFHSIKNHLYTLPDSTRVFVGHDYLPGGRELRFETTIGESKQNNIHLNDRTSESEYIQLRETRDASLFPPRLLIPSIQMNIDAGILPPKESNGKSYLKLPLDPKFD
jgi:glyoxylase-like metal-dependent hydrolase (beta-lactamase superfamily II)